MPSGDGSPEATIEELVELEAELTSAETGATGTYDDGIIADVATVPAGDVPGDYPVRIETTQALRIHVDAGEEMVPVYLEWPGEDEQSDHVARLLDALDREPGEFADIYGDRVALDVRDGWHGIDAERTAALQGRQTALQDRTLRWTERGLAAGVAAALLSFPLAESGLPGVGALGSLLLVGSWFAIPAIMYLDVGQIRDHVGVERSTGWLVAALLPLVNVLAGSAYLVDRRAQLRGIEGDRPSTAWRNAVVAGIALPFVSLPVMAASAILGALLFTASLAVLPLAIYFDAEYVAAATDEDPNGTAFAIGSFVGAWILLGWLVGVVYLLQRPSAAD